jgi:adenylate cyclase
MQRKLTVILSADVVGYSGLMERDETGTLSRLKENRVAVFDPAVATHGGRQFKLMGDGALVEFGSVVAAINCALAIQEGTAKAEGLRYRIGINLGEVIIEGDDIYGEGVNVAARIQALAPVGGVALSRVVRDQADGKMPCTFDDMGEHAVKNIERPVHVFKVSSGEPVEQKVEAPRKLSICVLPFANMSDDPQQEYFSDGISEDIITDLSKVSALAVISRNSSFMYKGKHVDLPKVARELKVSHVLEGSVRKAGGRLRITAQLIDGVTNDHVWAERYDRDLNDIFALQDEISEAIVKALKLKLLPEEKKAIEKRGTDSVEAYNLYQMARQIYLARGGTTARGSDAVIRLCNGAVKVDPNYARAWGMMALAMAVRAIYAGSATDDGLAAADRALALDPTLPEAHAAKGRFLANRADFKGARIELNEALRLDPNSYESNMVAGAVSMQEGKFEDAIRFLQTAAEIAPTTSSPSAWLANVFSMTGDKVRARQYAERTLPLALAELGREPDNGMAMAHAALSLAILEQPERVKEMISRGLLLDPDNEFMKSFFLRANAALGDKEATIAMLDIVLKQRPTNLVQATMANPILDFIRDDPRVKAMFAAAEARLAQKQQ